MLTFDRERYFNIVRESLFGGTLTQQQVDGQNFLLLAWEVKPISNDLRHFAYPLATTMHETAATMWPIEEYGKGAGYDYGVPDPETGKTYYGRGDVMITWRENYDRATQELGLGGRNDLVWNPEQALEPFIAAGIMFCGMRDGWFRTGDDGKPETLGKYFNAGLNDPFEAREIINGDKNTVPSWSNGNSIGKVIETYHYDFLSALVSSVQNDVNLHLIGKPR